MILSPRKTMLSLNALFILVLALVATFVNAHGFLASVAIDGKYYNGNMPYSNTVPSPIRQINSINPIQPSTDRAINCGADAQFAQLVVDAKPGSVMTFDWHGGDNGHWPHTTGPMLTYMALCENVSCTEFDAINAKWFKIDQLGQRNDGSGLWVQQDLFEGKTTNVTIPANIAPGEYLVRHEVIGLHNAINFGGAEFYPSCTQIRISNNSNEVVQPSETVDLPGAYSDADPGIFLNNAFDPNLNYQFPGPSISNVVTNDEAASGTSDSPPCAGYHPRVRRRHLRHRHVSGRYTW